MQIDVFSYDVELSQIKQIIHYSMNRIGPVTEGTDLLVEEKTAAFSQLKTCTKLPDQKNALLQRFLVINGSCLKRLKLTKLSIEI
jgi:hypothetical protein